MDANVHFLWIPEWKRAVLPHFPVSFMACAFLLHANVHLLSAALRLAY